ncbi:MAG TPA: hypothetical protein GXZ30_05780 [Propionibacterium sp.]|nr:hypothetical protein [Propionibacterium sp.]
MSRLKLALTLVIVAGVGVAAFAGWNAWELRRPAGTAAPDRSRYSRTGPDREVMLPLTIEAADVRRLALLEFAPDSDPTYLGLEPQFIDRGHEQGYRIIAYRHDGWVDFYDDLALAPNPDEQSKVTGKGLLHYRHRDLGGPILERDDEGRATIEFAFTDVEGRAIRGHIREHSTKRSVPLNLLAPVGMSAVEPDSFPLIMLYDFDFLRLGDSDLEVSIDGRAVQLADFPVPLPVQGQRRSFAKYSVDTDILAVFPTSHDLVQRLRTTGDVHRDGEVSYLFAGDALERILVRDTEIVFAPALDVRTAGSGRFTITTYPEHGVVAGPYAVSADGAVSRLELSIDEVEVPRQRGLLYRFIVNESSTFGTWPKAYRYHATIDQATGAIDAQWTNTRPGGK